MYGFTIRIFYFNHRLLAVCDKNDRLLKLTCLYLFKQFEQRQTIIIVWYIVFFTLDIQCFRSIYGNYKCVEDLMKMNIMKEGIQLWNYYKSMYQKIEKDINSYIKFWYNYMKNILLKCIGYYRCKCNLKLNKNEFIFISDDASIFRCLDILLLS